MIYELNAEGYAIECALNSQEAANALKELSSSDMLTPDGVEILAAMKRLSHVDRVTVDEATNHKFLNYFTNNTQGQVYYSQYKQYITSLKNQSHRRNIARAAQRLIEKADDLSEDIDAAAAEFDNTLRKNINTFDQLISSQEATLRFIDSLDKAKMSKRVTFGIPKLDQHLGGIFGKKLVVVGARTSVGKSILALTAAMSSQFGGDVLFCSYEMSCEDIIGRELSALSGVDSQKIAYRDLSDEQLVEIGKYYGVTGNMRIYFSENANTPAKVRAAAMRLNKDDNLSMIVVDYMQLMDSDRKSESKRVMVGQISHDLKELAKDLNVPVFALSQLNRQSTMTQSKQPTMAEMRDSGDIEQDADVVVLMYQPPDDEPYVKQISDAGCVCVRFLIEKNRGGVPGIQIDTAFKGNEMKFLRVDDVI